MASFTVEKFGIDRLVEVEQDEINSRIKAFKEHFVSNLNLLHTVFFRKIGALLYLFPAFSKSLHPLISPISIFKIL